MDDVQTMKAEVYDAFARARAKAVVAEETRSLGGLADLQRPGDTIERKEFENESLGYRV